MHAYRLRCDQLGSPSPAARMPVPLLGLRSKARGQGDQRTSPALAAGIAAENRRRPVRRGQAIYRTGRFPTDVTPIKSRRDAMQNRRRRHFTLAASGLALVLAAATASAQQPLPPLPTPDTPPPVPPILQSYKPVTQEELKQPQDGDWLM